MARKPSTASSSATNKTSKRPVKRSKDSTPARASKKTPASAAKSPPAKKSPASKKPAPTKKESVAKKSPAVKSSPAKRAASDAAADAKKKSSKPAAKPAKTAVASKPEAAPAAPAKSKGAKPVAAASAPAAKPAKAAPEKKPKPSKSSGKSSKKPAAGGDASATPTVFRGFRQSNTLTEIRAAVAKVASAAGLPAVKTGPDTEDASQKKFRKVTKSPLTPKQLAEFTDILLQKRRQLEGDVSGMELEALRGGAGGSLSHLPQHMADQGSDAFEQSLSLDLAASQRDIIKEIDAALARIENGTFGICERLGKPIRIERLRETPWARYSIEAARDIERGGYMDRSRNQS